MGTEDFSLIEATELPQDLVPFSAIDKTPRLVPTVTKTVPDQLWSVVRALYFIEGYRKGARNPAVIAEAIDSMIQKAVEQGITSDDLNTLYEESTERRADIELDPVAEDVYRIQRDPRGLEVFIVNLLDAMGIEITLGEDLTTQEEDTSVVDVTDPIVSEVEEEATEVNPQEAEAARIATKLGLEAQVPAGEGKNLVSAEPFEVDSTDPYVKQIKGQ